MTTSIVCRRVFVFVERRLKPGPYALCLRATRAMVKIRERESSWNRFQSLQTALFTTNSKATCKETAIIRPRKKKKLELLRERTKELLREYKCWGQEEWQLAKRYLFAWTRQPQITKETVENSFALFDRMVRESQIGNFPLGNDLLNRVLDRWRIGTRRRNVVDRQRWSAPRVLELMKGYEKVVEGLTLDTKSYAMIMAVGIKQDAKGAPQFCADTVQHMKKYTSSQPNEVILTYLMDAHVKSMHSAAAYSVQAIFDYMVESGKDELFPSEKTLTRLMEAWVTSGVPPEEAVPHMERSLHLMLDKSSKTSNNLVPNSFFASIALDLCLARGQASTGCVPLADAMISLVHDIARRKPLLALDSVTIAKLVALWAKSSLPQALERSQYWLTQMQPTTEPHRGQPATEDGPLHESLQSLAESDDPSAGKTAEIMLLRMQELNEAGFHTPPTFSDFQRVIDCWARCGSPERASAVLQLAEDLAKTGDSLLEPQAEGYISVMEAWATSRLVRAPEEVQALVKRMSACCVLLEDEDFLHDSRVYTSLVTAYALSGREDAATMAQTVFDSTPEFVRDTRLYNALILAQDGNTSKAESILEDMLRNWDGGLERVAPDTQSFNNVLVAWSRSGSPMAAWRADGIFSRMVGLGNSGKLDVHPDSQTFDLVISILANEWGSDAAQKIDQYLQLLKEHCSSGGCLPGAASYTQAIRAWSLSLDDPRSVLRAKAILDEMDELSRAGVLNVKPNRETYSTFLRALSVSNVDRREQLAKDAVLSMKSNEIELDSQLLSHIQRCSLPCGDRIGSSWTVFIDDALEFPVQWVSLPHITGLDLALDAD